MLRSRCAKSNRVADDLRRRPISKTGLRVNDRIRAPSVRLIDQNGKQLGIVLTEEARRTAAEATLDLVEVAPNADPPVCRILDYGKYKYKQKKKLHQGRTKQHVTHVKELRLRPKIDKHDLVFKIKKARGFLQKHDRVQFNVLFRGREMAHVDLGRKLLERVAQALEDVGRVEQMPGMQGRKMFMTMVSTTQETH